MTKKVLGLLQKRLSKEHMKRLNIVPYPDRVALLSLMTFDKPPTIEEINRVVKELGKMSEMFCKSQDIDEVLIGGANYLTPFLVDELKSRNLIPVFLWMDRKLKGYQENSNGRIHGEYAYFPAGFVKPYTEESSK